jgi:hypothetical protein
MSLESNKLRDKGDELWKRSKSLEYEAMLVRLILNDKATTRVESSDDFPQGHGQSLGGALLCNTVVTDLEIDLDRFLLSRYESQALNDMKPLLMFLDNNSSLIRFGVHAFDFSEESKISSTLLQGVSKCTQLERLQWSLPLSAVVFHRSMTTLASLRELDLEIGEEHWYSRVQKRAIASAFQSNNTLQKLKLCVENDLALFTAILMALHEHGTLVATMMPISRPCFNIYALLALSDDWKWNAFS